MIVILNAPPHAGKDTIADMMKENHEAVTIMFKYDLYKATAKYFEVPLETTEQLCSDRKTKDKYSNLFGSGRTPREALIYVSEEVLKPKHGKDYFGRLAAQRILDADIASDLIVFSDGGFIDEVIPLTKVSRVLVVRLHGRGSFENDSRNYITDPRLNYLDINLVEGKPEIAVEEIIQHLGEVYDCT